MSHPLKKLSMTIVAVAVVIGIAGCCKEKPVPPAPVDTKDEGMIKVLKEDLLAMMNELNARARPCSEYEVDYKGVLHITKGVPGDSMKVEMRCDETVIQSCIATVAAGATMARCETAKENLQEFFGKLNCPVTVLAGDKTKIDFVSMCMDP